MSFINIKKNIITGIVYHSTLKGESPRFDKHGEWIRTSVLKTKMNEYFYKNGHALFNIEHSGKDMTFPVLEHSMRKNGDYVMSIKMTNPDIWTRIKNGELNGFSMTFSAVEKIGTGELVIIKIKGMSIVSIQATG